MLKPYVITATHGKHEQSLPHDLYVLNREGYHMNERERQLQDINFKVKNTSHIHKYKCRNNINCKQSY